MFTINNHFFSLQNIFYSINPNDRKLHLEVTRLQFTLGQCLKLFFQESLHWEGQDHNNKGWDVTEFCYHKGLYKDHCNQSHQTYRTEKCSRMTTILFKLIQCIQLCSIYTSFQCYVHRRHLLTCYLSTCYVTWPT